MYNRSVPRIVMGRASSMGMNTSILSTEEMDLFHYEWEATISDLSLVHASIAESFNKNYNAYAWCLGSAKSSFGNKEFGGLKPMQGQFGWRLPMPRDVGLENWQQVFHQGHAPVHALAMTDSPPATPKPQAIQVFHGFLQWPGEVRALSLYQTVNGMAYVPWVAPPYVAPLQTNVPPQTPEYLDAQRPFCLYPMARDNRWAGTVVYSGLRGSWSLDILFDIKPDSPAFKESIMPLGIVLAEYDYLAKLG